MKLVKYNISQISIVDAGGTRNADQCLISSQGISSH